MRAFIFTITIMLLSMIGVSGAQAIPQPPDVLDPPVVTIQDNRWHCLPPTFKVDYDPAYTIVETESGSRVAPGTWYAIYNSRVDLVTSGWFYINDMRFWGWQDTGWDYPLAGTASSGRYNSPAPGVPCQNTPRVLKNGIKKPVVY